MSPHMWNMNMGMMSSVPGNNMTTTTNVMMMNGLLGNEAKTQDGAPIKTPDNQCAAGIGTLGNMGMEMAGMGNMGNIAMRMGMSMLMGGMQTGGMPMGNVNAMGMQMGGMSMGNVNGMGMMPMGGNVNGMSMMPMGGMPMGGNVNGMMPMEGMGMGVGNNNGVAMSGNGTLNHQETESQQHVPVNK